MENLSQRQQEILDFIEQHIRIQGHSPSFREIAAKFDIAVSTVQDHIEALIKKKLLKKAPKHSRSFQVPLKENRIPIFAAAKAGSPGFVDEQPVDHLSIEGTLGLKSGDMGVYVKGDSMYDAGITDGSVVFFRRADYVKESDIIVARVDDGVTIKRFSRQGKRIVLKPENAQYKPIIADPEVQSFDVIGKVVCVVKNFASLKPGSRSGRGRGIVETGSKRMS